MALRIGVYPGTFDPFTLGHADIVRRAAKLVDRLVVGVTTNAAKSPMFSLAERMAAVEREAAAVMAQDGGDIRVTSFGSLLVDFAVRERAGVIVRGLRGMTDFDYEDQMAGMNHQLGGGVETVFLMANVALRPIASRLVREIALLGGDIAPFVSPTVRAEVVARVRAVQIGEKPVRV